MTTELLERLCSILPKKDEDSRERLSFWNSDMESLLLAQRKNQQRANVHSRSITNEEDYEISEDLLSQLSLLLHSSLLNVLEQEHLLDEAAEGLQDYGTNRGKRVSATKVQQIDLLCEILRSSQNWLRWYLQVYRSQRLQPRRSPDRDLRLLKQWKTQNTLKMCLYLLEKLAQHQSDHPDGARYVGQLLFYVTFPITARYPALDDAYNYLVAECNIMERFLRLLLRENNVAFTLSLVRNVHNALVSFPQQSIKAVEKARVDLSSVTTPALWTHLVEGVEPITYKVAFRELALFILQEVNSDCSDPFLSESDDDRRAELVIEILRCCYALRVAGSDFVDNERWQTLIKTLLKLDSVQEPSYECQLATIALLMDAGRPVNNHNFLSERDVGTLLLILEKQVTTVLKEAFVDDRAAAALTPILAVLHKFCGWNHEFLTAIREGIFLDDEGNFQVTALREDEQADSKQAKNMSPLHAPKGSLQWKLIQLLTWPQGFVKRLVGELLFVLCHGQPNEFVRRVGMGNAMPLLGLKGLVQLPPSVYSSDND